jgi:indolepyruvate ferredoxin oxidoreductase, beta subunit
VNKIDFLVTGVGGQGVIVASDIIGEAALASGYDVKKTDTLGMAQRGGSVISHLRIAKEVFSPLIREGDVDILLAFEKLEGARWAYYLNKQGIAILNNQAIPPLSVSLGKDQYPSDERVKEIIQERTSKIYLIDGSARAAKLGNIRTLNTLMLGCISVFTPIEINIWKDSIAQHVPAKFIDINMLAFDQGRKEIENAGVTG